MEKVCVWHSKHNTYKQSCKHFYKNKEYVKKLVNVFLMMVFFLDSVLNNSVFPTLAGLLLVNPHEVKHWIDPNIIPYGWGLFKEEDELKVEDKGEDQGEDKGEVMIRSNVRTKVGTTVRTKGEYHGE